MYTAAGVWDESIVFCSPSCAGPQDFLMKCEQVEYAESLIKNLAHNQENPFPSQIEAESSFSLT